MRRSPVHRVAASVRTAAHSAAAPGKMFKPIRDMAAKHHQPLRTDYRPCRLLLDLTSQEPAMDKLSVYDAKARFSELVERAESGR